MDSGEPQVCRWLGPRKLGRSTGVPIEESGESESDLRNNNNELMINKNVIAQQPKQQVDDLRKVQNKKKLAQIFNRSFFSKNSKFFDCSTSTFHKQQQVVSETNGDQSHNGTSGDEDDDDWQLLEPDEEEEEEEEAGVSDQNLQFNKRESSSDKFNEIMSQENNSNEDGPELANGNKGSHIGVVRAAAGRPLEPKLIRLCTTLYALIPLASLIAFNALLFLIVTRYWLIPLAYFTYLLLDRQSCNRGGRRWEAFYCSRFWTYLAAYFPIRLRFSSEFRLDPNENYILNYHPHGIAAFGCVTCFATNGLNFKKRFPGIVSRFMVHETTFCVPLMREIFTLRGDCSVNSKSFDHILEKKWRPAEEANRSAGNLLALVGGGLAEADLSDGQRLKIVVASRKGFVKKALVHGANLIPCIAFGENSVYTKINFVPNSLLHRLETRWYNLFKFKHPFYYGTSIFGASRLKGALPYKRPITVVMGDPIKVERVAEPSQEQVDQLHARYLKQLEQIYSDNSDLCSKFDQQMEFV